VLKVGALWYYKIFSCVQRSSPAAGCARGGEREREEEEEDMLAESAYKNCKLYINIS
jgi:hypothetical protein